MDSLSNLFTRATPDWYNYDGYKNTEMEMIGKHLW